MKRLAFLVALIALVAGPVFADRADSPAEQHIAQAVDTYARAMASTSRDERLALFATAERQFTAAVQAGAHNADLLANLGNAALQAERRGPAILAYRRALLVDASHARARQNLEHARSLLPEFVPRPVEGGLADTFFFWREQLSVAQLALLAAACFALGAALLSLWIVRGTPGTRLSALLLLAIWAGLLASAAFDARRAEADAGVVIAPEATARAADSLNAPRRFSEPLPGGTELRILEDRGGWLHVELHNGRQAWLLASTVGRVGEAPPR